MVPPPLDGSRRVNPTFMANQVLVAVAAAGVWTLVAGDLAHRTNAPGSVGRRTDEHLYPTRLRSGIVAAPSIP